MKRMLCLLSFVMLFAAASACVAADDPNMGTWKLNEAKSKFSPGAAKNTSVVYEAVGDSGPIERITVSITNGAGGPTYHYVVAAEQGPILLLRRR